MTFPAPAEEWSPDQIEEFRELWEAAAAHFKHHPPPTCDDVAITDEGE